MHRSLARDARDASSCASPFGGAEVALAAGDDPVTVRGSVQIDGSPLLGASIAFVSCCADRLPPSGSSRSSTTVTMALTRPTYRSRPQQRHPLEARRAELRGEVPGLEEESEGRRKCAAGTHARAGKERERRGFRINAEAVRRAVVAPGTCARRSGCRGRGSASRAMVRASDRRPRC